MHVAALLTVCSVLLLCGRTAADALPTQTGTADVPTYRIYPLRNGVCSVSGKSAFLGGDEAETYEYALYAWLVLGGEKPILVDAGLKNVAEMNRGAAKVLREPVTQREDEAVEAQLRRFGLAPDDIGHVLVTHMHFDHVDGLTAFTKATVYVGKKEWGRNHCHAGITREFKENPQWKKRLALIGDGELLPGIEAFWVGGHTPGSMAYCVNTVHGRAVLTGDTVSLLANTEKDIPIGVYSSEDECRSAMEKIREKADIVLPSHDPGTSDRWPPVPEGTPEYAIRAIKVGECQVRDHVTFQDSEGRETSTFYLYVWAIQGGGKTILVDTGSKHPEEFSRATSEYIPGGVKQLPEEDTIEALKRHGISPEDVSHVIVTHLHADHYDYFDAFPDARFVINTLEFQETIHRLNPDVMKAITSRRGVLQLVEDEEIVPGVRVFPLGCHTPGSQGVLVQTHMGPVLLTGDVVYKYENIEKNRPIDSPDEQKCLAAMAKIRSMADIVLPAHDPLTLVRWPGGLVGSTPGR